MSFTSRIAAFADLPEEDVEVWVACQKAERLEEYIRQGRIFRTLPLADLRRVWKAEFRDHVKSGSDLYPPLLGDLTQEFELRGVPSPEADIPAAWNKDQERCERRIDEFLEGDALDVIRRKVEAFTANRKRAVN
jgi:hypothetical protein